MNKVVLAAVTAAALLIPAAPSQADVIRCSIGDSGVTYNRNGVPAQFENLRAMSDMNSGTATSCGTAGSARINQWQCDAYDSHTSFLPRVHVLAS